MSFAASLVQALPVFVVAMACTAGARILQKMREWAYWEGVWPCLSPWGVVRLRTLSSYWNDPGKDGPHSELFFFLIRKVAGGSHAGSAVGALCLCGNAQGVCVDWSAPFGNRR